MMSVTPPQVHRWTRHEYHYWIVNLVKRQLEVYRQPVEDDQAAYGWKYAEVSTYQAGQSVAPLHAADQWVAVVDLLP
jgi:hypothetical protein